MSSGLSSVIEMDVTLLAGSGVPAAEDSAIAGMTGGMVAGDEAAYRAFHGAYAGRLRRYLWVVCRGDDDAADEALQQTYLRVVRHVRRFGSERDFWRWLAALARSAAMDGARRRNRYTAALARLARRGDPSPHGTEPDGLLLRLETLLEAVLAELPEDDRRLLIRRYREGSPVRELALASGVTEKAIECRVAPLRQKVRDRLRVRLREDEDV